MSFNEMYQGDGPDNTPKFNRLVERYGAQGLRDRTKAVLPNLWRPVAKDSRPLVADERLSTLSHAMRILTGDLYFVEYNGNRIGDYVSTEAEVFDGLSVSTALVSLNAGERKPSNALQPSLLDLPDDSPLVYAGLISFINTSAPPHRSGNHVLGSIDYAVAADGGAVVHEAYDGFGIHRDDGYAVYAGSLADKYIQCVWDEILALGDIQPFGTMTQEPLGPVQLRGAINFVADQATCFGTR